MELADHAGADLAGPRLAADQHLAAAAPRGADLAAADDPAGGLSLAAVNFGESPSAVQLLGVMLVLAALLTATYRVGGRRAIRVARLSPAKLSE